MANSIKENTQQNRENRNKEKRPKSDPKSKTQSGSLNGKGTNHVPNPPLVARSISKRKKLDEKLERVVNLEKPSPKMTTNFKIKVT